MKKYTFLLVFIFAFMFAGVVYAQEAETAGNVTPPTFFGRVAEGFGTFFTFGNTAKAERYLVLAERRLAEAEALAEDGDERAEEAVRRYEAQIARAQARAERTDDVDLLERVSDNTTRHISVLDEVLARVPEQARDSIRAAKEQTLVGQVESLRVLGELAPERAVDVFSRAAEARLRAAEARAARGGENEAEDIEEALGEYEKYAEFGRDISTLGQGLRTGDATVEELVRRAGEQHLRVLQDVQTRVPFEAQDGIRRALLNAEAVREARPISPERTEDLDAARARLFDEARFDESKLDEAMFDEDKKIEQVRTITPLPATRELPQRSDVREEAPRTEPTPIRVLPAPTPLPIREEVKDLAPVRSITPTPATTPAPIPTPAPTTSVAPARVSASIEGFAFTPSSITVKKGTTVVWTNKDSVGHTVTGGERGPDSRLLGQGESYSFTFDTAGTFNYKCTPHPSMLGVVTVVE